MKSLQIVSFLLLTNQLLAQSPITVQPSATGRMRTSNTAPAMIAKTSISAIPIEQYGANAFYSADKFYGTMTITPYASGDSSLVTYTGADNPFTAEYLNKDFVAFKAHKTDSFPTVKNWIPGVSSCVYSKVIKVVDGKNVRVNFKYNGNNEASPQSTTNAFGYFFFDNRAAFNAALAGGRQRPIALQNGATYVTKGLFGTDYYATENPIIFVAADTNSTIPANIKYSIEDEWTALGQQLWGGWNEGVSIPTSYSNEFGNRLNVVRLRQDVVGGQYIVRFTNIRMLPPHYSNRWQQGSSLAGYFAVSGGSFTRQHWGIVDIAGSDCRHERKKYSSINFPDTPSFTLPFGLAYSNGGGKAGSVVYPTGTHTDVVEFMDYCLRPNPANTANSTWLSNATFANLKNKVKTALSTIAVGDGTGGYGIAGNKFTLLGIGRNSSVAFEADTLLADIGLDISPNTRVNSMRTQARFREATVNGEQRLVMDGSSDSAWTVWSVQTYYDWSTGMVGVNDNYAKIRAKVIAGTDTLIIALASAGSEQARPSVGLADSRSHVVQGVRTTVMTHTLPSVGASSKLYIQSIADPKNFSIWPHLAIKGDTITVTSTGHQYRVSFSQYIYTITAKVNYAQGIELQPIGAAPALSTATNQVLDISFNTAKARSFLNTWYAGAIIEYPRQISTTAWDATDLIVDGGEMNYGDNEVNHEFANMRKWGNLRYGTEYGDHVTHYSQLWRSPKIQSMKNVFEYRSADWYGAIAGRSFWRREVLTGVRQYYTIDGGWMKGVNGGGAGRVKFLNKPKIGGGANPTNIIPVANAIPSFLHGFTQDGNGVDLFYDVRVLIPDGDTMDARNATFSDANNGFTIQPNGPNSVMRFDNFLHNGLSTIGGANQNAVLLRSINNGADTSLNVGVSVSSGNWVGKVIGNNVVLGFSGTADYSNLSVNLTGYSAPPNYNRWGLTTTATYPLYCAKVLINGQSPVPNSSPISFVNPCPPL